MNTTQHDRTAAIETALGSDKLLLRGFSLHEQLGRLFEIEVDLASEEANIPFDEVLGKNATIRLENGPGTTRFFNGFVSRFEQVGDVAKYSRFRATLVPWLWFLTRTADCRIFQNKTAPEIIEQVFKWHGFGAYKLNLSQSYSAREYCVQYRETDFNFVSRLMEEEGIYYFFQHENGRHTLILADSRSAHKPAPNAATLAFRPLHADHGGQDTVNDWSLRQEVQPIAYGLKDFNFQKSKADMLVSANTWRTHGAAMFEVFDYPGSYGTAADGERIAQARLDELQAQFETARAQTNSGSLACGSTVQLSDHPRKDQNREYLITGLTMQFQSGGYASGDSGDAFFSCAFTCIPSAQTFRSPRITPRQMVQGPQTAIVVGPAGEELHVDKFSRVKVQFHWDRYGKADENSSCYVRVSQGLAGKQWGGMQIPRIGQEVVVDFLEGDPDKPLITGRVYNDAAMPPYPLPKFKNIGTLKSNSTKGGAGFNEIRFDDTKGEEQLFVHAEKNHDIRIKNDAFEWIGRNRHLLVKKNQTERIENDRHEKIARDHVQEIGRDRHLKVKGKEAIEITGSHSLKIKDEVIEVFEKNQSTQITKDLYVKAQNIVIEGAENITLHVGNSFIAIESGGIKLGTTGDILLEATGNLKFNATQNVDIEATKNASLKGTAGLTAESTGPAEFKSVANLTIKGLVVQIN